jgi:hypothetical protein
MSYYLRPCQIFNCLSPRPSQPVLQPRLCWRFLAFRHLLECHTVTLSLRSSNYHQRLSQWILWLSLRRDNLAPSWPVNLSVPPWLLPPSAPPDTLTLSTPLGSLIPWSVVTPPLSRTCRSSAILHSTTAAAGSSFPSGKSQSSITPTSPLSSGTLAPPQTLVTAASPRPPVPAMLLWSIGSPSAPWDPSAPSPSLIPQLTSASTPPWLLPPSTSLCAVVSGLWVCALGHLPSSPPGSLVVARMSPFLHF